MIIRKSDANSAEITAEKLRAGGIVIVPTDTVYGFSGIVDKTDAQIRLIKGREETKPFIRLIAKPADIFLYTLDTIPDALLALWPGALTIVVNLVSGGTAAFRCPGDSWLRAVIEDAGMPLYSTSVNRSGSPVLSNVSDIIHEFDGDVSLIVDDGNTGSTLPSTIVDISGGTVTVLRQGTVCVPASLLSPHN